MATTTRRKKIPSNLRKRVPKPGQKVASEQDSKTTVDSASKKKPAPPKPKPQNKELPKSTKPKTTNKEVKKDGTKAKKEQPSKQAKAGASEEVTKPASSSGSGREESRPRPANQREDIPKVEGQLNYAQLKELSYTARVELFRNLNKGSTEKFIQLIKREELPKKLVMRKLEAEERGVLDKKPSRDAKVYYCPYCVDYMKFIAHSFTGYDRCCGCGMTTKDFYISADNELFNKG